MPQNPMQCCVCGAPANVFLSTIVGNEVKDVSYCQQHADAAGLLESGSYGFIEQYGGAAAMPKGPHCPKCNVTLIEVRKMNRFGCAECYETFEQFLEGILQRMHKRKLHLGKIPKRALTMDMVKQRVKHLESELARLIEKECFEDAAEVRDMITNFKVILADLQKPSQS